MIIADPKTGKLTELDPTDWSWSTAAISTDLTKAHIDKANALLSAHRPKRLKPKPISHTSLMKSLSATLEELEVLKKAQAADDAAWMCGK